MIHKTKGIVLHRFKYSDSKLILKIFTREFGLQSYLFFVSKSPKKRFALNLLQPLYLLNLEVYHKETGALQKIKEFSIAEHFNTIPYDIKKQSVSLFLSEFLLKVLQENEKDTLLFDFVYASLKEFDDLLEGSADFHLYFLVHLTEFLGILPDNNFSDPYKIFDLEKAKFIIGYPTHQNFFSETLSEKFSELLQFPDNKAPLVSVTNAQRRELLNGIIGFYNYHLERPGKIKSLEVLAQIFS